MENSRPWRKTSRYCPVPDHSFVGAISPNFVIIQCEVPPEAEWWDKPLLPNDSYKDLERGIKHLNIRGSSVIDHLIQHPIPILPPGDKNKVAPKPLMLTKKVRHIPSITET